MKKKIVAITANTGWYIYNFRKNTILALIEQGYEVIVCAPSDKYSSSIEELGCIYVPLMIDQNGKNPLKDLLTLFRFYKVFEKYKVDVALNFTPKNNIYSTIAAKLLNIKVINNIAGLGVAFSSKNFLNLVVRNLYKYSQQNADFIFFQNKEDATVFKNFGIKDSNTDILPGSGVDLRRFNVCPPHTDNVVRFALVARMLIDKGVMQFIESAEILKSKYSHRVEFLLVGFLDDDNPRAVPSSVIEKWTNKGIVKYLGVSDFIEDIVSNVDCVVLPSFYREGVPKSLLEAAAMGRPLITTDSIGCKETVINNVTGYLCKPRSVSDLCAKMEKIISMSKEDKIKMGLAGRQYIERNFDERIVIDKYINVLNSFFE